MVTPVSDSELGVVVCLLQKFTHSASIISAMGAKRSHIGI